MGGQSSREYSVPVNEFPLQISVARSSDPGAVISSFAVVRVEWPHGSSAGDYVWLSHDRRNVKYSWCSRGSRSIELRVQREGRHGVTYCRNGGTFSSGRPSSQTIFEVSDIAEDLTCPEVGRPGEPLECGYLFKHPPGFGHFVSLVETSTGRTVRRRQITEQFGTVVFNLPRVSMTCSLNLSADESAETVLLSKKVSFNVLPEPFIGILRLGEKQDPSSSSSSSSTPTQNQSLSFCTMMQPGETIPVMWNFPLQQPADRIVLVPGLGAKRTAGGNAKSVLSQALKGKGKGRQDLRGPSAEGVYSLLLLVNDNNDPDSVGSDNSFFEGECVVVITHLAGKSQLLNLDSSGLSLSTAAACSSSSSAEQSGEENPNVKEFVLCKLCAERPVQIMLQPCGHAGMCEPCGKELQERRKNECPWCRQTIRSHAKLYFP
uniref:RING-type domain-containing protein n=1 Tax=Chromera velia CCMP2878 TaxID=1169474 RepID=A0A0G4HLT4_9ALVE|eukprot:Cvel_28940.t1-p1 / transcript=Cvel_28940.t1 / gene=Cvel_28940 / organism=Chromera_velia_CCMP2878 / gene_product=hypothetical protein / transcript_product=hypothetical protein / location=Cvel_scaffold3878:4203-5495(+) / protein_length=431 / sequence_SO=supercontig / SO=protein_coding / is_pseudo=false